MNGLTLSDLAFLALPRSSGGTSLLTGLTEYWDFDESTTGASAVNSVVGGVGNMSTSVNGAAPVTGPGGHGARNMAANSWFSGASHSNLSTNSMTINLWVNATTPPSGNRVAFARDADSGSNRDYQFIVNYPSAGNHSHYAWNSSGTLNLISFNSTILNTTAWLMVTSTYSPTAREIFYNGVSVASTAWTGPVHSTSGLGLSVGRLNISLWSWDGGFSMMGYWNRVLTPAEITLLYNSGNGRNFSEL